ncbi:MAG: DEAD/DEAH box helicase [Saprospiraceae bacterium]|jgi:ATP-dependent RNA helicase RhlE|nr:DEAD/DEAH box helicase [Saprospiraceae bacterium]
MTTPTFDTLNLSTPLLNALRDLRLTQPTPIQEKAFPVVMSGRDVVGIAQTGTGKTYAYLLPILRQLAFSKQKDPRVLILVPTRELAIQVAGEIQKLTTYMSVRTLAVYGGVNINTQKLAVQAGVDILVGTPGRVLDMALSRFLLLSSVRQLVIDEVDEMLNLGFRVQLTGLLDRLPARRQNLLFSATMTDEVDDLIETFFNGPVPVEVTRAGTPLEKIRQSAYRVSNFHTKLNLLEHLLATDDSIAKTLIFCPSKRLADMVQERLEDRFPGRFSVIHSNKSQNFRINAVKKFDAGELRGLITTDLLARGLDVTDVTHVLNLNTPDTPEAYIHRIGRTGRADSEGAAITFVTEAEREYQSAIEALMGKEIPMLPLPEGLHISLDLIPEELPSSPMVNYLPKHTLKHSQGAFHEKKAKNKKVNLGNRRINAKKQKYKKPIKKKR